MKSNNSAARRWPCCGRAVVASPVLLAAVHGVAGSAASRPPSPRPVPPRPVSSMPSTAQPASSSPPSAGPAPSSPRRSGPGSSRRYNCIAKIIVDKFCRLSTNFVDCRQIYCRQFYCRQILSIVDKIFSSTFESWQKSTESQIWKKSRMLQIYLQIGASHRPHSYPYRYRTHYYMSALPYSLVLLLDSVKIVVIGDVIASKNGDFSRSIILSRCVTLEEFNESLS
jgi:hypothetical protein